MKLAAPGLALGLIGLVLLSSAEAREVSTPVRVERDSRLQQRVECQIPGRSVGVWLSQLSAPTQVGLSSDREVGDQKLVLVTRFVPTGEVLKLVAQQFGFHWITPELTAPGQMPESYRLIQNSARKSLGRRQREAAEQARTELILARLELRLRNLDSPPEALALLLAQDPFIDDLGRNQALRARLRLTALLTPTERRNVAAGKAFLSPPLNQLPPAVQELALTAGGRRNLLLDRSQLRFTVRREEDNNLKLWLLGPDGRPVGHSSGLTFNEAPRREASVPVPPSATDPQRKPLGKDLEQVVELLDENKQPLPITVGLPVLLPALARASGANVLSDYYAGQTIRFDAEPLGRRPLWQILNLVAEQYCLTWKRQGSFFLFRHREWYEVEPEEIPERVLNPWRTSAKTLERTSAAEALEVITALSREQMAGLPLQFHEVRLDVPYAWERFLATFSPEQCQALLQGEALEGHSLSAASQAAFSGLPGLTPTQRQVLTPGTLIRLRMDGAVLAATVEAGDVSLRWGFQLPFKQPSLPPVWIKLQ